MKLKNAVLGVVLFLGAGCGVETTEPVAEPTPTAEAKGSAQLLARVERDNGNVVQFYETSPGVLLVGELGRAPNPPSQIGQMSPVDAWRKLTGKSEAPEALVAAQHRAEQLAAKDTSVPLVIDSPVVARNDEASPAGEVHAMATCDRDWFRSNFCVGSYDWSQCLTNHKNGAYAQSSSIDYHKTAICGVAGIVVLSINYTDVVQAVNPGYYYWYWGSGSNFSYRSDVTSASGDTFHFFVGLNG